MSRRVHADDIVIEALTALGIPYRFGGEASAQQARPAALDCSELVEWACHRVGLGEMPDGSWRQYAFCHGGGFMISVGEAIKTRGALLFRFVGDPLVDERPPGAHVALSLGDGRTVEASASRGAVVVREAEQRGWTHGTRIPFVEYRR